jgi:hypothetical protein
MTHQVCVLFELHGALGALEWELACVFPLVSNKETQLGESFRTMVAFVGFAQLVGVLVVPGQLLKKAKVFLTKGALKRRVRDLVSCQGFGVS